MARTSNRELARQLGVSETAVRRAERAGRIRRETDGSWNPAKVHAAWSDNTDQAQQRPAPRQRTDRPRRAALKPVPEAAVGAVRDTLREHGEPIAAGAPGSSLGQAMTFMQARTANEVLKAQERRLRLQQTKGELMGTCRSLKISTTSGQIPSRRRRFRRMLGTSTFKALAIRSSGTPALNRLEDHPVLLDDGDAIDALGRCQSKLR
jgi:hypothetical protein